MNKEELLKLSPGELTDLGICPTCFNRENGGALYGDNSDKMLYEDEDILLLNKPAGVLRQKAKPEDLSLNEWLIGHLLATDAITEADLATFHPSVCNRLDRNTSGIVLCGKTLSGSQALSRIIKDRTVKKYYQTICKRKVPIP